MSGQVYYVIGPPGTGKTSELSRQAKRAVDARGPSSVVCLSLTRTAASEIAGRDTGVPHEQIGTMHSIIYRAAGEHRLILDSPKGIRAWNEWIETKHPEWKISGSGTDPDDPHGERSQSATSGDDLLEKLNLLRHRRIPPSTWPESVRAFANAWIEGAEDLGAFDFTCLIETGLQMESCPGSPSVLLCDEVQDWSKLEASVIHRWAQAADTTVMVGDEDQCLYQWRGGDPRVFLDHPVPDSHQRVLGQSYRVPQAVHALAQTVIGRVPGRAPIAYAPTTEPGLVTRCDHAQWKRPEGWLDEILAALDRCAKDDVTDPAHGVLVLAPCSYQLDPLLALLRKEGIPFGNRFRQKRGDWNPLAGLGSERATAANQLAAFLGGDDEGWPVSLLRLWIPLLRSTIRRGDEGVLARGAKTFLERTKKDRLSAEEWTALWQSPLSEISAAQRSVRWLLEGASQKDRDRLRYPLEVFRRGGLTALQTQPLLTVGTIHSAKGGEADHVLLLSALPPRWAEAPDADEIHRLFYVAVTRARRTFTDLGGDAGRYQL